MDSGVVPEQGLRRPIVDSFSRRGFAPLVRSGWVERDRLIASLDVAMERPVTVIAAPAGYGKTTLVAQWSSRDSDRTVAWVTSDTGHNDPVLFWTHIVTALSRAGCLIRPMRTVSWPGTRNRTNSQRSRGAAGRPPLGPGSAQNAPNRDHRRERRPRLAAGPAFCLVSLAVAAGFEPAEAFTSRAFEARSLGRSDTPPPVEITCRRTRGRIGSAEHTNAHFAPLTRTSHRSQRV